MLKSITRLVGYGSAITHKTKPESNSDPIVFVNQTEGWPGSGFERQITELTARRVYNDRDETQISVSVTTCYEKTQRTIHGHVTLDAAQLAEFISHLALIPVGKA